MTEDERKEKGLLWCDTGEYFAEQARAKDQAYAFNHLPPSQKAKRDELLHEIFASVGKDVWIEPTISLARGKTVTIGDGVYINSNLTLIDDWKITIGNHVLIATGVTICTTGHPLHYEARPNGEMISKPVVIEDWAWIGSNVVIMPGVTIGRGAVVGAGSIVTKDVPPMTVAVGNPCRVVREITEEDKTRYRRDL